jgi:hypothetical protein
MGAAAGPKGFPGPYTKEDGFMGYNEVSATIKSQVTSSGQVQEKTVSV